MFDNSTDFTFLIVNLKDNQPPTQVRVDATERQMADQYLKPVEQGKIKVFKLDGDEVHELDPSEGFVEVMRKYA